MKRSFAAELAVIGVTITGITIATVAQAQGPAQTPAPSPRPLVGETMPVGDLTKTIHFYHNLLGLENRAGDPRVRLGRG